MYTNDKFQFDLAKGDKYDWRNPAFTTILTEFDVKAKKADKNCNLKAQLDEVFSLPKTLIPDDSGETELLFKKLAYGRIPSIETDLRLLINGNIDNELLKIVVDEMNRYNTNRLEIRQFYNFIFEGIIEEPKIFQIERLDGALQKFDTKRIGKTHLATVTKELSGMQKFYNEQVQTITDNMKVANEKKAAYIAEVEKAQEKLKGIRNAVASANGKMNTDNVMLLYEIIRDLDKNQDQLKDALRRVAADVNFYKLRRILWSQSVMGIQFFMQTQKKSSTFKSLLGY